MGPTVRMEITQPVEEQKPVPGNAAQIRPVWFGLGKSGLGILSTLTANYGVKQSQFTKPTPEPLR